MNEAGLLTRWRAAAVAAGATRDVAVVSAGAVLLGRWREPHRRYHNVDHLTAVLAVVDAEQGHAVRPDLVRLAAWCHDAVYDPRAAGDANERASAELAAELLTGLGVPGETVAEVVRLVLLTVGHRAAPEDQDGALLCDADLAILASPAPEYDRYAAAIRAEYAHVPDPAFQVGRAAVLRNLLALPALFHVPALARRGESAARDNLRRELARLGPPAD
ncbi:HD domain-containing protein [Plantactinospora sonchi]|uniref:Metal-dependent phosphohydrolase n=1 Tax=Plantactinospora sonchi TaxID=1544735 RepID=A0ABU7S3X0_9ACTN